MTRTVECVVWCETCREDKYTVYRVLASNEGVGTNVVEPAGAFAKKCHKCETVLTRKP